MITSRPMSGPPAPSRRRDMETSTMTAACVRVRRGMTKNVFLPRFFLSPLPFAGGSRQAMQVRRQNFFQPPGDSSSRVVSKHRASVIDERGCDDELATGAPGAGERRGEGGETQARGEGTSRCFRDARAFSLCPLPGSSTSAPMAIPRALFRERPRPPLVAPRLT